MVGLDAIYLDEELTKEFITWSRVVKENCTKWVEAQKTILEFWAERLRGVDLRRCNLDEHIRPPLKSAPAGRTRSPCSRPSSTGCAPGARVDPRSG